MIPKELRKMKITLFIADYVAMRIVILTKKANCCTFHNFVTISICRKINTINHVRILHWFIFHLNQELQLNSNKS